MKTLIIGGTGMIGGEIARLLEVNGHEVVVGARRAPDPGVGEPERPVLLGDYAAGDYSESDLERFDAVVFAAGQDVRHVAAEQQTDEFWVRHQSEGVPNFFAVAKRAGVPRAVQIGSYYHMVVPDLVDSVPYIKARKLADDRSRELADSDFNVCTLNASKVLGPGQRDIGNLLAWARGEAMDEVPDFAPTGGTNNISVRSVARAVLGALQHAEPGAAYLVGDENNSWLEYFQLVFELSGGSRTITESRAESHPYVAEMIVPLGTEISFDPTPAADLFGYRLNDVRNALEAAIADFDAGNS
jgi:dihydroflavonol-4-reductase